MHSLRPSIRWLTALLPLFGLSGIAAVDAGTGSLLEWRRTAIGVDSDGATALALDPRNGRLAVGDARGVLVGSLPAAANRFGQSPTGPAFERVLYRGPVRDLAYTGEGRLLVATEDGLYRVDPDGRRVRLALGAGSGARSVLRVATRGVLSAAATEDGLFLSTDTDTWRRPTLATPRGAAQAVALRAADSGFVCWAIVAGELWRTALEPSQEGWSAVESRRIPLPAGVDDDRALDVAVDLDSAEVAIVFPTALAVVERSTAAAGTALDSAPVAAPIEWKVVRPQLPPGSRLRRLVAGAGRFWLATDRGLLESAALTGPWRRVVWATGSAEIAAVAAGAGAVFAAAREGVWVGSADSPGPDPARGTDDSAASPPDSTEPSIAQVHRAAIHYLGLGRSRMEALRRGARRRGWLPIVTVRGGGAWDHFRSVDEDEAYLSGETRYLTDRDAGRGRDYDVALTLSWDLRDLAYERESIDVSHEAREVIELRDDVLDEITQLYFERRAVLATLRDLAGLATPETRSLRLRADELAAAIDAWTGGWFSTRVAALAP